MCHVTSAQHDYPFIATRSIYHRQLALFPLFIFLYFLPCSRLSQSSGQRTFCAILYFHFCSFSPTRRPYNAPAMHLPYQNPETFFSLTAAHNLAFTCSFFHSRFLRFRLPLRLPPLTTYHINLPQTGLSPSINTYER